MALPYLIKYVYNNGTDEVIRRGKKIHAHGYTELADLDELAGSVSFRVKDDSYSTYYTVNINRFKDADRISLRCGCPYNIGEICRHEAASLFQLQEMLDKNMLSSGQLEYEQRMTTVRMKTIDLKSIKMFASTEAYEAAAAFLRKDKANILLAENEVVKATVQLDGEEFPLTIRKNEEKVFETSCTCDEKDHPLCVHKTILYKQLLDGYGQYYFDTIRNQDREKNKLLQGYGYSTKDDLKGKFEFTFKNGKPFLKVLDPSIKRIGSSLERLEELSRPSMVSEVEFADNEEDDQVIKKRLGIVLNANHKAYPYFKFEIIQGEADEVEKKFLGTVEKIDPRKLDLNKFSNEDKQFISFYTKLQDSELDKYLKRNSPFSGMWDSIIEQDSEELPEETLAQIREYFFPKLHKIFRENHQHLLLYFLPEGKAFKTANLKPLIPDPHPIVLSFSVNKSKSGYEVLCHLTADMHDLGFAENESGSSLLILNKGAAYFWDKKEDLDLAEQFGKNGRIAIGKKDWEEKFNKFISPLTRDYDVSFDKELIGIVKSGEPEVRLFLQEKGDYLLFNPVFAYQGFDISGGAKDEIIIPDKDKVMIVKRNLEAELSFFNKLHGLHSSFARTEGSYSLLLRGDEVLKNNWFFLFVDAMKELNVPVFGFEALKNFKFNTAKPTTKIHISSNTDWFDAKVDVLFGDQQVTVAEIKKALANNQQFVQLGDGTLGILPEKWIKKYSLLFRVGEGKQNELRLSKFHYSVIDDLYDSRDEEELLVELERKYEYLRDFEGIKKVDAPQSLSSILREYQVSGFQWLNYLNDIGWGGILADDMGLGKTIQTLSFLLHLKEINEGLTALVVCPTSLMFNWENEIQKFAPALTYHIHHGNMRIRDRKELEKSNIIITTYGTLRSDIKFLKDINFDLVILDESQAIKNPSSKVTKAAAILNAKNRICLSGTPLQNNTFDIYAQMNFLNPGMLGSLEFFRNEFSVPIDKFGDRERKDHLRKLLYPFILRRTKEQVAKDLPEKTETILFCEMGTEQRRIYDAYRNEFRSRILGEIEEKGMGRSQLSILQGLMKLRQICDSPAILNEAEKLPNHSIKLEELTREILEDISDHKALVFSQFLGMLALIRDKFDELGIKYEYFDGSTSAAGREIAINNFQKDPDCRVFLISLKAGGVGLNLTAADYVYIVDPWWNPAVEQQAIDRTHRIGQTKNIFAYRMICHDTIEDKIIKLQDRKRLLAKELIADDTAFVKNLTKDDVEYLFS